MNSKKSEARNSAIKGIRISCLVFVLFFSFFLVKTAYPLEKPPKKQSTQKIVIKKLTNGHYQLVVEGRPFIIKGVCYNPVPIGEGMTMIFQRISSNPGR